MGIKNLNKIIKRFAPGVQYTAPISRFAFMQVAVDLSLYLNKFKAVAGDRWLSCFVNLVTALRRNDVHIVVIYDGESPPEKADERQRRREQRDKLQSKKDRIAADIERARLDGEVSEELEEIWKRHRNSPSEQRKGPRLLVVPTHTEQVIEVCEGYLEKLSRQIIRITPEDIQLTKDLFDLLHVPWIHAPGEAELLASDLCIQNKVCAVLTEDTDVLAYGAPVLLSNIDTTKGTITVTIMEELLESLGMTQSQFLDLCIVCTTDYNAGGIAGIGPIKGIKLIQQHGSVPGFLKANPQLDTTNLKYDTCRRMFTEYERWVGDALEYCGVPDFDALEEFTQEHNIPVNTRAIRRAYTHSDRIEFE